MGRWHSADLGRHAPEGVWGTSAARPPTVECSHVTAAVRAAASSTRRSGGCWLRGSTPRAR